MLFSASHFFPLFCSVRFVVRWHGMGDYTNVNDECISRTHFHIFHPVVVVVVVLVALWKTAAASNVSCVGRASNANVIHVWHFYVRHVSFASNRV